jgi:hypothetical protein
MKDGLARLGKVIDHAIDKFIGIILETRKGYNQTVFLYNASGDDSVPCKNDKVIILKIDGTGNFIGAGVLIESKGAKPGEKIFFTRDAEGKIVSKLSMLNDGSVTLDTDTETTGEATGNYNRTIKGPTVILEKNDRSYTNEKNVNDVIKGTRETTIDQNETITVKGDKSVDISGDNTKSIGGDENTAIEGNKTENITGESTESTGGNKVISVGGGLTIEAGGSIDIKAEGNVTVNGQIISLN